MPVLRSLLRLLSLPFVANVGLGLIVLGMLILNMLWMGLEAYLNPVACWITVSVGWSAFAWTFIRAGHHYHETMMRRGIAVLIITLMLTALPYGLFTDDLLRYQWDGWLLSRGVCPYETTPDDRSLIPLAFSNGDATLPSELPYSHMQTIYPPGAQIIFGVTSLISGGDAQLWKIVLWAICMLCSAGIWFGSPQPQRPWLLLAGLSPIVLMHGWVDMHIDLLMALLLVLAIQFHEKNAVILTGLALGIAISIKYLPILFLPALAVGLSARQRIALLVSCALAVTALCSPFIGYNVIGSLGVFTSTWQSNSGLYTVLSLIADDLVIRTVLLTLFIASAIIVILRHHTQPIHSAVLVLMSLAIFAPVVHPWYLIPCLALIPWAPFRSTFIWGISMALYGVALTTYKSNGVWTEHPVALAFEFVPVVIAYVVDVRRGPLPLMDQK